jgi:hypothetical protein
VTVNIERITQTLSKIDELVSNVRHLLLCPEGVRITAIHRDNFSYVEYWDGEMPPRIIFYSDKETELLAMHQHVFDLVGAIPPSYCGNKKIELCTDLVQEDLPKGINIAIDIFEIEYKPVTDELIRQIRERHDFNNHLSRIRESQERLDASLELRGDK